MKVPEYLRSSPKGLKLCHNWWHSSLFHQYWINKHGGDTCWKQILALKLCCWHQQGCQVLCCCHSNTENIPENDFWRLQSNPASQSACVWKSSGREEPVLLWKGIFQSHGDRLSAFLWQWHQRSRSLCRVGGQTAGGEGCSCRTQTASQRGSSPKHVFSLPGISAVCSWLFEEMWIGRWVRNSNYT